MKGKCIFIATWACLVSAVGQSQPGFAVNFVVPSGSSNVDGNTFSLGGPAINQPGTIRYQQVYAASEFAYLTNFGGGWLIYTLFRGDATNGTQMLAEMPSVQVNVSTTQRGPDELSPVFSDNIGMDDNIVRTGRLEQLLIGGHNGGPEGFDFNVTFSRLFFYNPTVGNLLLDFRIYQGNTNGAGIVEPIFDAVTVSNDSVSRVLSRDVNATTGQVETTGLPTDLFFWPNPKLHIEKRSNSVDLWWPANPTTFVFQTTQNLAPQTQWHNITSGIARSNVINTYTIPLDSAGSAAWYRLVSTTP